MSVQGGPDIITNGLIMSVDANHRNSYPGTGTYAYNLVTPANAFTFSGNLSWQAGIPAYFSADGSGDGLMIADSSNLDVAGNFTLEGWIWWNQHKLYGNLLVKGSGGAGNTFNYCFFFYDTNIICGAGDGSGFYSTSVAVASGYINTGMWHHLVGTFNGATFKMYLDGVERSSTTHTAFSPYQNNYDLSIIQESYTLDGRVSVARVYNVCLTPEQVLINYNALKGRFGK